MGELLLAADQLMEKHSLNGSDTLVTFTAGKNVVVTLEADASPRNRDSSRVQSTMLSDYKWDGSHLRPHSDRLLSVAGNFISYRLSHDSSVEAVRVFERQTRLRSLIKGFRDAIVDLAWSRTTNMLAVLDASSNLYVYHVTDKCAIEKHLNLRWEDEDGCELLKGVNLANLDAQEEEKENPSSRNSTTGATGGPAYSRPRLIWCPYIPEEDDEPSEHLNMLAITKGRTLHIVNVSVLHVATKAEYVDLAAAREVEGAILTQTLENPITTLSMSPDATAMAVGDTSGQVSFFIIEPASLKFAHHWKPAAMSCPIKDLFFLDNYDQGESFWRFCLAVDEDGRQLYLFECENWTCVGKLRIESSMKLGKFMVQVDPTARYALLVDIDGANLFCIALDYSTPDGLSFAAITQIGFYHPLVAVSAFDVKDVEPPTSDFSFDDDDTHSNVDKAETIISLISITPRSVLHVDVTVEKPEKREQSLMSELASPRAVVSSVNTTAQIESSHSNPVEILPAHLPQATGRGSTSRLEGYDTMNISSSSNVDMATVMKMFEELNLQMDKLTHRVERADEERKAAATNESIVKMLQQFKEEFSLREDRLLANISDLIETSRAETVAVVRNALNENSLAVENSIQGNHKISTEYVMKVVSERTKEALAAMVIPSIDRVCTQLFKQLNEQFKEGLAQFMQQMRVQQAAMIASTVASTPLPAAAIAADRSALLHLIKTRQVQLAFETVLNQADESALQFVCRQIDPDELFGNVAGGDGGLSQPVLLSLLQQLSYKLDSDTDLKFRYIEHLLEALQPYDDSISVHVPKVVSVITDALNEFQLRTPNANLKRQARVITQLVRNLRQ
ncbi:hypothetical protein PFISCL1PPCAC_17619 [Pristionchus fissidentatus]|uniref:Enhancer of mRNA-decapping protein 4 WD40 repeat region domain-containing protein n=1 Tax=Pristionchus fissidentatus TaxID=1538716 RepID=A0AAV5W8B4_9BILA|nr:hypothetical protein PFISCL1PPCAC_17619 [Pristionchus fissidentatus]